MNTKGLIFNLILTLIVLFGACNKNEDISYTGLYNARITITLMDESGNYYDTTYQSIIIVNQAYGDQTIELQWSLDQYFIIHGTKLRLPNELKLRIMQPLFSYQKILKCNSGDCYFFNRVNGQIQDNELNLTMESSYHSLKIKIKGIKYEE